MCSLWEVSPHISFSPARLVCGEEYMKHPIVGPVSQTISAHTVSYSGNTRCYLEKADKTTIWSPFPLEFPSIPKSWLKDSRR